MGVMNDDMTPASRRQVLLGAGALGAGAVLAGCAGTGTEPARSVELRTAEVPVGGGIVDRDAKLVVTQPQAGQFRAFTAVCTHGRCTVSTVAEGTIDCPCHGSKFSITDGSVVQGPADMPLAAKKVTVDGETLRVG